MTLKINFDYAYNSFKNDLNLEESHIYDYDYVNYPSFYMTEVVKQGKESIIYIENVILDKPELYKKNHYFYMLKYDDMIDTYWFEYIHYNKYQYKEYILDEIRSSLSHITEYLEKESFKITYNVKESINFIRTHYITRLDNEWLGGDIEEEIMRSTPTFMFYNCCGNLDEELTDFAKKSKEEFIEKRIMSFFVYKPLSLKRLCLLKLPISVQQRVLPKIII